MDSGPGAEPVIGRAQGAGSVGAVPE